MGWRASRQISDNPYRFNKTDQPEQSAYKVMNCASDDRFVLLPDNGQTAPYCLLLRPESPFGRGALDLALETAPFKWQDWVAPDGRISSYRWQDNSASGMPLAAA